MALSHVLAISHVWLLQLIKIQRNLRVHSSAALATFQALKSHHLQYGSEFYEHTWHRTSSKSVCKFCHPAYLPFGKCNTLCKKFHLIVILHEMPLSIDISTFRRLPQAVQRSVRILADALSIKVHEPQCTLGLQISIATGF